jgi:hypothetical protein
VINYVLERLNETVWPYFWQLSTVALACTPLPASVTVPSAPTVLLCADTPDPKQRIQTRPIETSVPTYQKTVIVTITGLRTLNLTHSEYSPQQRITDTFILWLSGL